MEIVDKIREAQRLKAECDQARERCDQTIAECEKEVAEAVAALARAKDRQRTRVARVEDEYQLARIKWENANAAVVATLHMQGIAMEWREPNA